MKRNLLFPLAVCLAAAACDFKEKRSGAVTLAGAPIELNSKTGPASLAAGAAELTFKRGSSKKSIAIRVRQPGRPEFELEAAASGDFASGNFTLRGAEIGQPVDMVSVRRYTVTGPTQRYTEWVDEGMRRCLVEISYDPCDEDWTVSFRSPAGADLGAFASREASSCNHRRGFPYACHREPPYHDGPRYPRGRHGYFDRVMDIAPGDLRFD